MISSQTTGWSRQKSLELNTSILVKTAYSTVLYRYKSFGVMTAAVKTSL